MATRNVHTNSLLVLGMYEYVWCDSVQFSPFLLYFFIYTSMHTYKLVDFFSNPHVCCTYRYRSLFWIWPNFSGCQDRGENIFLQFLCRALYIFIACFVPYGQITRLVYEWPRVVLLYVRGSSNGHQE